MNIIKGAIKNFIWCSFSIEPLLRAKRKVGRKEESNSLLQGVSRIYRLLLISSVKPKRSLL